MVPQGTTQYDWRYVTESVSCATYPLWLIHFSFAAFIHLEKWIFSSFIFSSHFSYTYIRPPYTRREEHVETIVNGFTCCLQIRNLDLRPIRASFSSGHLPPHPCALYVYVYIHVYTRIYIYYSICVCIWPRALSCFAKYGILASKRAKNAFYMAAKYCHIQTCRSSLSIYDLWPGRCK